MKSHVKIFWFTILDMWQSKNPLYLIFRYANRYSEEINGNRYLTLISTNSGKEKIKKCEELWSKIWDLIRSITRNSDDYCFDEQYIKTKFD